MNGVRAGRVLLVAGGADAPSRIGFRSANLAYRPAGHCVCFVHERVFVACLDVQNVLLKRADDALDLCKE